MIDWFTRNVEILGVTGPFWFFIAVTFLVGIVIGMVASQ